MSKWTYAASHVRQKLLDYKEFPWWTDLASHLRQKLLDYKEFPWWTDLASHVRQKLLDPPSSKSRSDSPYFCTFSEAAAAVSTIMVLPPASRVATVPISIPFQKQSLLSASFQTRQQLWSSLQQVVWRQTICLYLDVFPTSTPIMLQ
jgi:hypothetical protein